MRGVGWFVYPCVMEREGGGNDAWYAVMHTV